MTINKTNEVVHPQKMRRQQATIVDIEWQWADDGMWIMTNNKTNEAVHPQKCAHHQRVKIMLVVVVLTICLPVSFIPNQVQLALPMVCG